MAKKVKAKKERKLDKPILSKVELLFQQSPLCRSCGCLMTICYSLSNSMTIQHNSPKGYPGYSANTTIWCHQCNQADAKWKSDNKIYSLKECLVQENKSQLLNGWYVVDAIAYYYEKSKLISNYGIIEFKFIALKRYIDMRISGNKFVEGLSFDDYLKAMIKGWFTLKHYYMGGGWYAYKGNPKTAKHWRFIPKEKDPEDEEERIMFNLLVNGIY
jgi:hypothetical protein